MPKITEIYAWICDEGGGDEGIPAMELTIDGRQMLTPMLGADMERIESLREPARLVAEQSGLPLTLKRFVLTED